MCIALCDAAALPLTATAMDALSEPAGAALAARDSVCQSLPWDPEMFNFTGVASVEQLASLGARSPAVPLLPLLTCVARLPSPVWPRPPCLGAVAVAPCSQLDGCCAGWMAGSKLQQTPCGCRTKSNTVGNVISYVLGGVAMLLALNAFGCWWYGKSRRKSEMRAGFLPVAAAAEDPSASYSLQSTVRPE